MSFIDYVDVITKLVVSNDKNIYKIRKNQRQKLHHLFLNNSYHNSYHNISQSRSGDFQFLE